MLKAVLSNGTFILGLEAKNVDKLKEGKTIQVDLSAIGGRDTIIIMYGETIDDIKAELQANTGAPLPEAKTDPQEYMQ